MIIIKLIFLSFLVGFIIGVAVMGLIADGFIKSISNNTKSVKDAIKFDRGHDE